MQLEKTIEILKLEIADLEKTFRLLIKDFEIMSSFKCEHHRLQPNGIKSLDGHEGVLCNSCWAKSVAEKWLLKLKNDIDQSRMGICKNCGETVRGLKGAPDIPVHLFTNNRLCSDHKNMAEFKEKEK